jgi:uncharacterized phage infection (PIP) family protein YhgE
MSKEAEAFVKDYKATQKQLKALSPAEAQKRKKALLAQLDKTWDAEDRLQEAIQKVRLSGVTGKKAADFIKHKEVQKPLKDWKAALALHHAGLKELADFGKEAAALEAALSKRIVAAEKDLKKSGGMGDMKAMATVKEAKRGLPDLKKSAQIYGTLQGHVVMYGKNFERSIEAIVKAALKEVDPKEFPKPFAAEQRKKTVRALKDMARKIDAYCKQAEKSLREGDGATAGKALKEANKVLQTLEKLNESGQSIEKKMKKEVKLAADGKEVTQLIKTVARTHAACDARVDGLEDQVEKQERVA